MVEVSRILEVERITNLARGFGWEVTAEETKDDKIILTIEKKLESPVVAESPA